MKTRLRIFVLYPILIGAVSGGVGLVLKGWLHSYIASFLFSLLIMGVVWLRFSVIPFLRGAPEQR